MSDTIDHIRDFWNVDSTTYDNGRGHGNHSAMQDAAWLAILERKLGAAPSRVLDVGAGTGFLSLMAARLGHRVTALDVSEGMLDQLRRKAEAEALDIEIVVAPAHQPPAGSFDSVIERHVTWTLPDPEAALKAWRTACPEGRLVLFEGLWGDVDPIEVGRAKVHKLIDRVRGVAPNHHGSYDPDVRASLPMGTGTHPNQLCDLVNSTGWGPARLERLRDVEWALTMSNPTPDRLVGAIPRFAITGG